MKKPLLVVILGPTAVGKTSLAIKLAKAFNSEILSSDSRQFYKEMSIGTAKPSIYELSQVPHHFINNLSIKQSYSVGDFEKEALNFLDIFFSSKRIAFLVGGSGLYIDAVLYGLDSFPEISRETRIRLNEEYSTYGIEFLQDELKICDHVYFDQVDIQNPQRLIRAIEIFRETGKPFSSFRKKTIAERPFNIIKIGISLEREVLYERINQRVDDMISDGLITEVESLIHEKHNNALQTVGYKEVFSYLENTISLEDTVELIKKNTRRYAKRQLTWFRKDPEIQWFENKKPEIMEDYIRLKMNEIE